MIKYCKAKMTDVEQIHRLITDYANEGLMLARPRSMLYEGLREFTVAVAKEQLVGTGALHIIWEDLAEVRALAVNKSWVRRGIGRNLVRILLDEARNLGIKRVFALTYQPGFFEKLGFKRVAHEDLPQKVWKECINCPKFPKCDEVAVIIDLD